jgi:hypothetical protein
MRSDAPKVVAEYQCLLDCDAVLSDIFRDISDECL